MGRNGAPSGKISFGQEEEIRIRLLPSFAQSRSRVPPPVCTS